MSIYCSNTVVPVAAAAADSTTHASDTLSSSFITVTTIYPVRTCRRHARPRRLHTHAPFCTLLRGPGIREPSEGCKLVCCQCVALRAAFPRSLCNGIGFIY